MDFTAQLVISVLCFSIIYLLSYYWNRRRMSKKLRLNRTIFSGHTAVLLFIVLVIQVRLLKRLDIYSTALIVSTILMAVATVLHNLSILFQHKAEKHKFIEKIHGPISHMMFSVPFGVNMTVIGRTLLRDANGSHDVFWSLLFLVITLVESAGGAYIGWKMHMTQTKMV